MRRVYSGCFTAPPAPQGLIDDDAGEPGAEPCLTAEGSELQEGAAVGVLQCIFRLIIVTQNAAGNGTAADYAAE